jgi:farnesyl diphosphate synthase
VGDTETTGKRVAKDAAAGKATLVSFLGVDAARAELELARMQAIDALSRFGSHGRILREAADFVACRER